MEVYIIINEGKTAEILGSYNIKFTQKPFLYDHTYA